MSVSCCDFPFVLCYIIDTYTQNTRPTLAYRRNNLLEEFNVVLCQNFRSLIETNNFIREKNVMCNFGCRRHDLKPSYLTIFSHTLEYIN
jgi:hypothetical protein